MPLLARRMTLPVLMMCAIVVASNILVQYPFTPLGLENWFTWGAFTYPVAFLVTDMTNRRFGPGLARLVVGAGFICAVLLSMYFATPRIAIASGSAFLVAQLLDVQVFDRLRNSRLWWRAPLFSSFIGSAIDTILFFTLAFWATGLPVAEYGFGSLMVAAPVWVAWALGDFGVKVVMGLAMLIPYGALHQWIRPKEASITA
ncbi:MAG: queuosine precursor transporter [Fimbriimonadaceae bacterium]|nr:queuosine precursor transporter [Alphaproteobacteria bacterium]